MSDYGRYCRPGLVRILEAVGLDAVYERAEGDRLWRRHGEQLVEVLDLVGGYGTNLFGHNHPELTAELKRLLDDKAPNLAQASIRSGAARLAKALCGRLGDYVVILTNSGTETIEAAIKHAYLERERLVFWAVKGAFHGKTLGAIQLTWSYRKSFEKWGPQVRFLDPEDPSDWEDARGQIEKIAAAFIEPILGEGGVKPLPASFVAWLTRTCRQADIPVVVDEIQTGMGRTGTFLASQQMGIEPDYLCLSKALGGGITKIGALLIKRRRFMENFSVMHTSTFAEDELSSHVALKALEILDRDHLPARCAEMGGRLMANLEALRTRFPEQIREVRGKGLMVGLELQDQSESPSNTLRFLSMQGYLGAVAAAYLLNMHAIRVTPTLSQPLTLRIEPSAYISEADLDRFVAAVCSLCEAIRKMDVVHLTGFQIGRPTSSIVDYNGLRSFKREKPQTVRRVAFIGHLISPEDLTLWEPSLKSLLPSEIEAYMAKTARILGPAIFDRVNVRSRTGEEVHLSFVGIYLTARQIEQAFLGRDYNWITEKIEDGVVLARDEGCKVVGLGGYTSIVSGNCRRIKTKGIALTSGNSLTVGMGIMALKRAAEKLDIKLSRSRLGVLGATGNIASTYAKMMAPHVAGLTLVVRDPESPRCKSLVNEIERAHPNVPVSASADVDILRNCALIVSASNSSQPLIYPEHLAPGPVAICDISIPADVADEVKTARPDVLVIQGGVARLPFNDDFIIGGIPLEKGHVFACMAETLLLGLENSNSHGSFGPVTPAGVEKALAMAEKHGFTLGRFKTERSY